MRKQVNEVVVSGEAWVSAGEKVILYAPHILAFLAMTGLGTAFATGWTALAGQGWGIYPIVGVGVAFVVCLGFAAIAAGLNQLRQRQFAGIAASGTPSQTVTSDAQAKPDGAKDNLELLVNKKYARERVLLDGKCLIEPRLEDVTLVYNGGAYHVQNMLCSGKLAITSDRQDLLNFAKLLGAFQKGHEQALAERKANQLKDGSSGTQLPLDTEEKTQP